MRRPALFSAGFTGPLHRAQGPLGGLVYTSSLLVAARGPGTPRRGRAAFWADPHRQRESDVVKRSCPIPASFSPPDVLSSTPMQLDTEHCHQAFESKDARFDGWFFAGVSSTGIYCRPSCPARTPKRENRRYFLTAAAAQAAGFRACKRCRPDASPGSPEWDTRADLVGRLMRLIGDGVVDREGVTGLAARVGFSERHVHRCLVDAVGAGPLALARAQRAQAARILLETTDLHMAPLALAAGFASIRQFNDTVREVFASTPSELRRRARRGGGGPADGIVLRLPYRAPLEAEELIAFLGARAIPGVEEIVDGAYRRSLSLPHGAGV